MTRVQQGPPRLQAWLNRLEVVGNRLPHPVLLFILLSIALVLLSALMTATQVSAQHPATGEWLHSRSLLSREGLLWMLNNAVGNFTGFAPVGPVIVAIMGIAIAEHSGLLACVLSRLARRASERYLSAVIVFTGVLSSIGFDSGYVVLIPLAALIFKAAGRPPLAGIAAAFAGVSGGYSANLMLGPVDAILAGISTEALSLVAPQAEVLVSDNYYFIIASTFLITFIGARVNDHIVEPRLRSNTDTPLEQSTDEIANPAERRALRWVAAFSVAYLALLISLVALPDGLLRNPDVTGMVAYPLLRGIVIFIALYAGIAGMLFGYLSGKFTRSSDWVLAMEKGMATLAGYLVLMFFAAQFVNYFAWSGIGAVVAIKGAQALAALQLPSTALLVAFVLTTAAINLLIGSASAKWALMAPIFVPMLYMLGIDAASVQMAYRIGDSSSNIITPLMPYFGVVVAFMQKHDERAGIGSLMALMLPYSVALLLGWTLMLSLWMLAGLPLGPG